MKINKSFSKDSTHVWEFATYKNYIKAVLP